MMVCVRVSLTGVTKKVQCMSLPQTTDREATRATQATRSFPSRVVTELTRGAHSEHTVQYNHTHYCGRPIGAA